MEGTHGHGVIDERLSTDLVSEKRRMAEKAANRDLYDHYKSLKKVYNDCVVTVVDGENKNLSNGDTVTIKITSDRGYDKDMLEQYRAVMESEEYKATPAYRLQECLKQFQNESGYNEVFIPAMQRLSPSYREYYKALQIANETFIRQYPQH